MRTNVASTSINAYRQKKPVLTTDRERVAAYIINETKHGRPVWRRKIARALGMEPSSVAGRVNEILKNGIVIDGLEYRVEMLPKKAFDQETGVTVQAFWLVLNSNRQMTLPL